jgi:broad specificity phosphatase PhoE
MEKGATSAPADLTGFVWLARHGKKEPETGECNWKLSLLSEGVRELESQATRLAGLSDALRPRFILCSPFPRCIATAAIYARALNIAELCIEPGLCEVLTPSLGMKGLGGNVPEWTADELTAIAQMYGGPTITINKTYAPAVCVLMPESSSSSRAEVNRRASLMAEKVLAREFNGWLFVTHGSPFKRMADILALDKPAGSEFMEPQMGALLCLKYVASETLPMAEMWLPSAI